MPAGRQHPPAELAVLRVLLAATYPMTPLEIAGHALYNRNTVGYCLRNLAYTGTGRALVHVVGTRTQRGRPRPSQLWALRPGVREQVAALCGQPVRPTQAQRPSFTCPRCSARSYNPNDIKYGYCGRCHAYTGDEGVCALQGHEGCTVDRCRTESE